MEQTDVWELPPFLKREEQVVRYRKKKVKWVMPKSSGPTPNEKRRKKDEAERVILGELRKHKETTFGRIRKAAPDIEDAYIRSALYRMKKSGLVVSEGRMYRFRG